MLALACISCQTTKAHLQCGLCAGALCKSCAQFVAEGAFSFLQETPSELDHNAYCMTCYESKVAPALENYAVIMENAKNILVFFKTQGKETRLMKRLHKPVKTENCADRDEVILRLAFQAAELGCNAIINVDLASEKVINGRWQTSIWKGNGIPTQVDAEKLARQS